MDEITALCSETPRCNAMSFTDPDRSLTLPVTTRTNVAESTVYDHAARPSSGRKGNNGARGAGEARVSAGAGPQDARLAGPTETARGGGARRARGLEAPSKLQPAEPRGPAPHNSLEAPRVERGIRGARGRAPAASSPRGSARGTGRRARSCSRGTAR